MSALYMLRAVFTAFGLAAVLLMASQAEAAGVEKTQVLYRANIDEKIEPTREMLVSALEGRNYSIINQLDVQEGLAGRGIKAGPILLVEFINLTKAFRVTRSNDGFEMFAPLRLALFEEEGKTKVMILRPRYIETVLIKEGGLSLEAKNTLEEFDNDILAILESAAAGGF